MILAKIKLYALIAMGFALTVAYALFKAEQTKRVKEKLEGQIQARKTADAVNKEIMEGMNDEQVEIDKARNNKWAGRNDFE